MVHPGFIVFGVAAVAVTGVVLFQIIKEELEGQHRHHQIPVGPSQEYRRRQESRRGSQDSTGRDEDEHGQSTAVDNNLSTYELNRRRRQSQNPAEHATHNDIEMERIKMKRELEAEMAAKLALKEQELHDLRAKLDRQEREWKESQARNTKAVLEDEEMDGAVPTASTSSSLPTLVTSPPPEVAAAPAAAPQQQLPPNAVNPNAILNLDLSQQHQNPFDQGPNPFETGSLYSDAPQSPQSPFMNDRRMAGTAESSDLDWTEADGRDTEGDSGISDDDWN